jgi:hypothetical protein
MFIYPDPNPGPADQNQSMRIRIRIHNTAKHTHITFIGTVTKLWGSRKDANMPKINGPFFCLPPYPHTVKSEKLSKLDQ